MSWNAPQTQETIDGYQVWGGEGGHGSSVVKAPATSVRLQLPLGPGVYLVEVHPSYRAGNGPALYAFCKPGAECAPSSVPTGAYAPARPFATSVNDLTPAGALVRTPLGGGSPQSLAGSTVVRVDSAGKRTVLSAGTPVVGGRQKDQAGNVYVQTEQGIWKVGRNGLATQLYGCSTTGRIAVGPDGVVNVWSYEGRSFTFSILQGGALSGAKTVTNRRPAWSPSSPVARVRCTCSSTPAVAPATRAGATSRRGRRSW